MRRFLLAILGLAVLAVLGYFLLPGWLFSGSLSQGTDMGHFHPDAVPRHIEALSSPDAAARAKAAQILWQIGVVAREATPALLTTVKDADPRVRAAAAKALGRTSQETQDGVPVLTEALKDDGAEVRAAAATSLAEVWRQASKGRYAAPRAPPGLGGENPGNAPPSPRSVIPLPASHEALARKAVPLLTAGLRDADTRVRTAAAEALVEAGPLGESAVPDLIQILRKESDGEARLQATLALGNIGPAAKAAVPVLVEKLSAEKVDGVRVNTAVALGMIRSSPETVLPALIEALLKDEHPDVRGAAMVSVGTFGPDAKLAIPIVQQAAKDPANQSEETARTIQRLLNFLGKERN